MVEIWDWDRSPSGLKRERESKERDGRKEKEQTGLGRFEIRSLARVFYTAVHSIRTPLPSSRTNLDTVVLMTPDHRQHPREPCLFLHRIL